MAAELADAACRTELGHDRAADAAVANMAASAHVVRGSTYITGKAGAAARRAMGLGARRKPGSAFIFYRLRDGSAWVSYTIVDERQALAPWLLEEGWDEARPSSVGVPDQALGVYIGRSLMDVTNFLNQRQTKMRTSTDPTDFDGL